ncbi:NADH kinase Pos5p, mitochondrial [Trichomonascus vanleenenianus]|uniref:NADH kinase n=1 Tax=Trichomonascus vanleenenianus TaxID=2268995 RepID=UPI003ECACA67
MRLVRSFSTARALCKATIKPVAALEHKVTPFYTPEATKSLYSLTWDTPPRNVCVIKKPWNKNVRAALIDFIGHVSKEYSGKVNIIVEQDVAEEIQPDLADGISLYTGLPSIIHQKTDLLVTLGGDGTILHAASLFASTPEIPPVLSFSLGTLGFLLPFDIKDQAEAFHSVYSSQCKVMNRFRLQCDRGNERVHAMNDLTIYRGSDPHLTMLDISVDGQFVTKAIADGVTISTPTGSTAYSLSSGGSIVHPSVSCILITPICPRSLSFRPLIFPATSRITLNVAPQSRGRVAELSVDGIRKGALRPGDEIVVQAEKGPSKGIWCVTRTESDWVHHLNGLLGFNSPFGNIK